MPLLSRTSTATTLAAVVLTARRPALMQRLGSLVRDLWLALPRWGRTLLLFIGIRRSWRAWREGRRGRRRSNLNKSTSPAQLLGNHLDRLESLNVAEEVAFVVRNHPVLLLPAIKLARLIKERRITSSQLTHLFIQHIQRVNPKLNAIVVTRFEQARNEARRADMLLNSLWENGGETAALAQLPPFHGVPCTVKEVIAVKDTEWTAGLVQRKGKVSAKSAPTVLRLQKAGFIVMGKGNISEACMWMESNNWVYGRSNNPYDLRCTTGGSSGGGGAITAACGTPFALASDVGGSIRIPAFFNGLFGHKPTGGCVPNSLTQPVCHNEVQRYCQIGPLTRSAVDLMPILKVLAGPDKGDSMCYAMPLGDPATVDLAKLRILNCTTIASNHPLVSARDRELVEAQQRAVDSLRRAGCEIVEVEGKNAGLEGLDTAFGKAFDIWAAMMSDANELPFRKLLSEGKSQIYVLWELFKWLGGASQHTLPALLLALVERVPEMFPGKAVELKAQGLKLRDKLVHSILASSRDSGHHTVLLYPSLPNPAPRHNELLLNFHDSAATCIFNVLELPVTQVPLGLSSKGLPLGLQVVANSQMDHVSIAVAIYLEQQFGGWRPPRPYL